MMSDDELQNDVASIRIATRSSKLALWQAEHVRSLLIGQHRSISISLVHVSTVGDRDQAEQLRSFGGLGVFTREVQRAVLDGRADIAVHSLKDLPTEAADGLLLAGIPVRASRLDALVFPQNSRWESLDDLPPAARIGTGSPRRQAMLLRARPDLQVKEIRGNVDTRLAKLDQGEFDAIVLAEAGLSRLNLNAHPRCPLRPPEFLPAVGQGALGIECRSDDGRICGLLAEITDRHTQLETTAERTLLSTLRAGCHAPLGVLCERHGDLLSLHAALLSPDGTVRIDAEHAGGPDDAERIGKRVADELLRNGGAALITP